MSRRKTNISFDTIEKLLLNDLLDKRIKSTAEYANEIGEAIDRKKFEKFYLEPCLTAQFKITEDMTSLTKMEKLACISVVNKNKPKFYKELESVQLKSGQTFEIKTKAIRSKIDSCNNILKQCGHSQLI